MLVTFSVSSPVEVLHSVSPQLYMLIICITIIKIDVLEGNLARPAAAKEVVMPFAVTAPEGNAGEMSRKPHQSAEFQIRFSQRSV